ncbi:hypothetical protein K450DRAFT_241351 [Umbelopsis ramanniana AG]|uniref:Succinate dehydrogenase [ubiquinone] cytochrome b small subunit n=1 Tax=Umbelopsis ramanniana AG TaxID=1314678 RepID=A0AAD5E8Z2_UMBRA|nr:uncharacterized protein K450DRAFT_241351 [Umbelopsis ramanniana AG]KAI8579516.1 hypothetical protein K450DRAFT_241351 [Umbelopsis ramanniana AG]
MSLLRSLRLSQHLRQGSAFAHMPKRPYSASNPSPDKPVKATADAVKDETTSEKASDEKKDDEKKDEKKDEKEVSKFVMPNYVDGSFHWSYERAASVALIPLISTQVIYGAHPVLDGVLGLVLPLHLHIGFDACITDYFPARNYPRANKYLGWGLKATSAAVIWGCFEFNTNDVGITELVQRTLTA